MKKWLYKKLKHFCIFHKWANDYAQRQHILDMFCFGSSMYRTRDCPKCGKEIIDYLDIIKILR